MTHGIAVATGTQPSTMHDFGGFAQALYDIRYPAPGHAELALAAADLLSAAGHHVTLDAQHSLDDGAWVREAVLSHDRERLLHTLERAPHAARAHPTTEHFLLLLVAAGAAADGAPVGVLAGGMTHGMLAMESYLFGAVHPVMLQAFPERAAATLSAGA